MHIPADDKSLITQYLSGMELGGGVRWTGVHGSEASALEEPKIVNDNVCEEPLKVQYYSVAGGQPLMTVVNDDANVKELNSMTPSLVAGEYGFFIYVDNVVTYKEIQDPRLNASARQIIEETPAKFKDIYGEFFVSRIEYTTEVMW